MAPKHLEIEGRERERERQACVLMISKGIERGGRGEGHQMVTRVQGKLFKLPGSHCEGEGKWREREKEREREEEDIQSN